ncbi:hypothetical protein D3C85_1459050 [compost metagenome]
MLLQSSLLHEFGAGLASILVIEEQNTFRLPQQQIIPGRELPYSVIGLVAHRCIVIQLPNDLLIILLLVFLPILFRILVGRDDRAFQMRILFLKFNRRFSGP